MLDSGFSDAQWTQYRAHKARLLKWQQEPLPGKVPLVPYKQKNTEIPVLANYEGELSNEYWAKWTKRTYESIAPAASWVCPERLEGVAACLGYSNERLTRVLERLRKGADIGCKGNGRLPTRMPNGQLALEYGERVADSLQDWIKDGIAFGPLLPEEMPWQDYSINPVLVRLKPNGKARIIINMSSPHHKEGETEDGPKSVNHGISKDEFPATMSSVTKFCGSLMLAGCPAEMCKLDWNSAYKHQAVRDEDLKLQVFEFGGRLFGEMMLVFRAVSSAGIYDDLAKVIKELSILRAREDERLVNQHLDDVVACGTKGDGSVSRFHNAYREISEAVGVSLADGKDPDKAFNEASVGKVLGVMFDLDNWTWWISDDKLIPILHLLVLVRDNKEVSNGDLLSLNGKLTHYCQLVPGGPWQRGFLLAMQLKDGPPSTMVEVTDLGRKQASWWLVNIRTAGEKSTIRDPRPMAGMISKKIYTDAAGGSESCIKNGAGGFCPPSNWFYLPWSRNIQCNRRNAYGVAFAHKLSCLEGFACLVGLASIPDVVRNSQVQILTDNAGFVAIFKKKHSKCPYSYTIAKALHDVSAGLACNLSVVKTPRVSGDEEVVADALSKGDWDRAWPLMPGKNVDPDYIPRVLLRWLSDPYPDLDLGLKVLDEMSRYTAVLYE